MFNWVISIRALKQKNLSISVSTSRVVVGKESSIRLLTVNTNDFYFTNHLDLFSHTITSSVLYWPCSWALITPTVPLTVSAFVDICQYSQHQHRSWSTILTNLRTVQQSPNPTTYGIMDHINQHGSALMLYAASVMASYWVGVKPLHSSTCSISW